MNKWIGMGRLCADPEVKYSNGENATCIARYRIAVDRRFKRDGEQEADFISIVAFGKLGEFAEKYLHKGTKVVVAGRIQTGSYTNNDGIKVYTTDIIAEEQEFAESKNSSSNAETPAHTWDNSVLNSINHNTQNNNGFSNIPGIQEELPFM